MFKKEYQGGSHVEVFTTQGRDPTSHCRLVGSVKRFYDKQLHSYVYLLDSGSSSTSSRIQLPKDDRSLLGLVQPCLVLQLVVPEGGRIALEVGVVDGSGTRHRVVLSTSVKDVSSSQLHARVPLPSVTVGKWQNLCVDLKSLMSGLFKSQQYKSLEYVSLGGTCSLRRIFTLQNLPSPGSSDGFPRSSQMPTGTDQPVTSVVSFETVMNREPEVKEVVQGSGEVERVSVDERPTHVAFGKRVPIPEHILSSRKSSRPGALPGTRGVSATDSEGRMDSDRRGLQPHPLVETTGLNAQKKKGQRLNGDHAKVNNTQHEVSRTSCDRDESESGNFSTDIIDPSNDGRCNSIARSDTGGVSSVERGMEDLGGVSSVERGMEDLGGVSSVERGMEDLGGVSSVERGMEDLAVVDLLKSADVWSGQTQHEAVVSDGGGEGPDVSGAWSNETSPETTYSFSSYPKSAANMKQSLTFESTSRRGQLDDDFVASDNYQEPPHGHYPDDVNVSRLSDDYDWRQYASLSEGSHVDGHLSLGSRLPADTVKAHGPDMDNSLSGSTSITLSGWTERYRQATGQGGPLHDSLDISDMGGTLTPALGNTLTEQPDFPADLPGNHVQSNDQELDLMYDPQLNCFYDPVTNKYYELLQ